MRQRRALPIINLTDAELGMGSSFGNSAIWVNTKSTGAVERLFSNVLAQRLIGTISLRYGGFGLPPGTLEHNDLSAQGFIALRPETAIADLRYIRRTSASPLCWAVYSQSKRRPSFHWEAPRPVMTIRHSFIS